MFLPFLDCRVRHVCALLVFVFLLSIVACCVAWRNSEAPHGGRDACAPVVSVRGDWHAGQDLNSHPTDLKSVTLPIELPT